MKTVKVPCPKCGAANHYPPASLSASDGQAQCAACKHVFTLVRKAAPKPEQQGSTPTQASKTTTRPTPPDEAVLAASGWKASSGGQSTPLQAEVLPKASTANGSRPFAEKEADKTFQADAAIEALLQRNNPPANSPPATLPTIDTLLKNVQQHGHVGGPTQNIHIQAQSLVFNLVSGKEAPAALLQQPPLLLNDDAGGVETPEETAPVRRKSPEFNWTLACLVALTTLIVQIFYYFLTRM